MNILKRAINRMLSLFGYTLHYIKEPKVVYENFINLAEAYELLLNKSGTKIDYNYDRLIILARMPGTVPFEAYTIIDSLNKTDSIEGDVCEFGVAQGETSALIANEILTSNKALHLFDSFEGLPRPSDKDKLIDDIFKLGTMEAYTGTMSNPEKLVHARLNAVTFPESRIFIHKGFVDKVFKDYKSLPKQVSFAYVDFDFYEPIKITLEFLHQTVSRNSIIVIDDYDFFSTGSKIAVDEFVSEKNAVSIFYNVFVPDSRYGHFAVLTRII